MMDKREMIERALRRLSKAFVWYRVTPTDAHLPLNELLDALADQAIVIECEVEHARLEDQYKPVYDKDVTYIEGGDGGWPLHYKGHHGTPGKAIAIVVSLEEE